MKKTLYKLMAFALAACMVVSLLPATALAASLASGDATWHTGDSVDVPFMTQGGASNYTVDAGATVRFNGGITVDSAATITGSSGSTLVRGSVTNELFNITTGALTLSGLTIDGSKTTYPSNNSSLITVASGRSLTISGVTFKDNIKSQANAYGGAIYSDGGNVTINSGTTFSNNSVVSHGGAIFMGGNSYTLNVTGATFTGNQATGDGGGAIWLSGGGNATITNSSFTNNSGSAVAVIFLNSSTTSAVDGAFTGTLTLNGVTITNNTTSGSRQYGGAVTRYSGTTGRIVLSGVVNIHSNTTSGTEHNLHIEAPIDDISGLTVSGSRIGITWYPDTPTATKAIKFTQEHMEAKVGAFFSDDPNYEVVVGDGTRGTANDGALYLALKQNKLTLTGSNFTATSDTLTNRGVGVFGITPGASGKITVSPAEGFLFDDATVKSFSFPAGVTGSINESGNLELNVTAAYTGDQSIDLSSLIKKSVADVTSGRDTKHYANVTEALNASTPASKVDITSNETPATTGSGTLAGLATLTDYAKNKFVSDDIGGANVTVTGGVLTGITSGSGVYTGSSSIKVGAHDVQVPGGSSVNLNATDGTAKPQRGTSVTIDGITYSSSSDVTYPLGDPMSAGTDIKASIPSKKSVTAGDNVKITAGGSGTVEAQETENGVTVKAPSNATAEIDGIGTFTNGAVDIADGKATLTEGSVGLAAENSTLYVPCGDSCGSAKDGMHEIVSRGSQTVTVSKEADETIKITVPTGGIVEIDGKTYTNPGTGDMVITLCDDSLKNPAVEVLTSGPVTLKPSGDGTDASGVEVLVKGEDGNNAIEHVENTGTADVKVQTNGTTGTATLPKDGKIAIGDDDSGTTLSNKDEVDVVVDFPVTSDDVKATAPAVKSGNAQLEGGSVILPKNSDASGASVTLPRGGEGKDVKVQNTGDKDILIKDDYPTEGSTVIEIPDGGKAEVGGKEFNGPATVVVGEDGEPKSVVYQVGTTMCTDVKEAEAALSESSENTVKVVGRPDSAQEWTGVEGLKTFVDYYGRTYTIPDGGTASLTVETDGSITITGGEVEFDPTTRRADTDHAMPDDLKENETKVKHGEEEQPHTVESAGKLDIIVADDGSSATVTPESGDQEVTIDDVKYSGTESSYDLDKPFEGLKDGGKATIPENTKGTVKVPGTEGTDGFTVEVTEGATNSEDIVITKGDKDPDDGKNVAGQVVVPDGSSVKVNDNTYTGKSDTKVDLVKDSSGDYAELVEGEIVLPADSSDHNNSVHVNGQPVVNSGNEDITVRADENGGHVDIPNGGKAKIGKEGKEFTASGDVTLGVDEDGGVSLEKGSVDIAPDGSIGVTVKDEDGKPVDFTVENNSEGEPAKNVTVNVDDEGKGTAKVPDGGKVTIGPKGEEGTEYEAVGVTVFEINPDNTKPPKVTSGGVNLDKDESVGFGEVELKAGDDGDDKVKVEVQKSGDKAKVTVPAGGSLTVTDKDGKTHTYTNSGEGELELEVDENGNVTLKDGDVKVGSGDKIFVPDADGTNNEALTAGADGATLSIKKGEDDTTKGPATLKDGSVILGDEEGKDSSVKVGYPETDGTVFKGHDVEVFAKGEGDAPQVGPAAENKDGKVQLDPNGEPAGKRYLIPRGNGEEASRATLENEPEEGKSLSAPAMGVLSKEDDNIFGEYNVKPTEDTAEDKDVYYSSSSGDGSKTEFALEPGTGIDVKKGEETVGKYENPKGSEDDVRVTLDTSTGEIELEEGTVHIGDGSNDTSLVVEPESGKKQTITSKDATVTRPGEGESGTDVTVPSGDNKSVKVNDKEYSNKGSDELKLHIDDDGNVSVKSGTAGLGDGTGVKFGETEITNPAESNGDTVTVTVPVSEEDGYGEGSAKVVVPKGGEEKKNSVVIGDKEYENSGESDLELEVTPDGEVKVHSGEVKLPDGGSVTVSAGEGDGAKDYTVEGKDTKVKKDDGNVTVTVPGKDESGEKTVTITPEDGEGSLEYTNPGDKDLTLELPVDKENGWPTISGGSVELDPDPAAGGHGEGINVDTGTNSTPVENTGDEKIVVNAKGEGDANASVDIPAGGSAGIGGNDVKASGGNELHVELTDDGGLKVQPGEGNKVTVNGKTYEPKSEKPDAKLTVAADGTVSGKEDFNIYVDPNAGLVYVGDGETVTIIGDDGKKTSVTGGPAWINVENGEVEAVTVEKDEATGKEKVKDVIGHFSNADEGDLELTIQEKGEEPDKIPETTLKGGSVSVEGNQKITVGDETKPLTTGSEGATLSVTKGDSGSVEGPAKLTEGSVILPADTPFGEDNASVKVTNGNGTDTTFKGQNVEVFADGSVLGATETGGTVRLSDSKAPGTTKDYFVPNGDTKATLKADASGANYNELTPPAMQKLGDKLGGDDEEPYVIVPDDDNSGKNVNIYVDDSKKNDKGETETTLHPENGAAFDVKPKNPTIESLGESIGNYEAADDLVRATVNHKTGEVTLTEGTLKVSGNGKDAESGAEVTVSGQTIQSKDVTVKAGTGLDGGKGTGADITVPAGGSVTINGKTYSANGDELKLWMDENGNVYLKSGTVELGDGAEILFENTKFTNPAEPEGDKVTVTATAADSEDGTAASAELTVPGGEGNGVTVKQAGGDRTYENGGSGALVLESDKDGNVTLTGGTVTLPEGGAVKAGPGGGCTVTGAGVDVAKGSGGGKDTVTAGTGESFTVTVPDKTGEDGNVTKGGTYSYENSGEGDLVVELLDEDHNLPTLKEGKANLGNGSALGLSGASVENTGSGKITLNTNDGGQKTVTIPEGGSGKVNGVTVHGAKDVDGKDRVQKGTVEESGTVKFDLGKDEKLTVNGVTYVGGASGGSVSIAPDGTVSYSGDISKAVVLGEATGDITLKDGESLTILDGEGKTLTTVTDKAGDGTGSVLSVDANGDISMKSGDVTIKGTAKTTDGSGEDTPEGTKPKWTYVGDVNITLKNESGAAITEAGDIEITIKGAGKDGGDLVLKKDSGLDFGEDGTITVENLPYGSYEVEIKNGDISKTTGSINVNAPATEAEFEVETVAVNTSVSSDLDKKPMVDGLADALSNAEKQSATVPEDATEGASRTQIDIDLKANKLGSNDSEGGIKGGDVDTVTEAIENASGAKVEPTGTGEKVITDLIDVTVTKTVTDYTKTSGSGWDSGTARDPEKVSNTASLIELRFPLSTTMTGKFKDLKDASDQAIAFEKALEYIFVYRQHGELTSVEPMRKVSPEYGRNATVECYYIDVTEGSEESAYIVIKANKFSVYAFGVSDAPVQKSDPSTGGSGGVVGYPVTLPESVEHGDITADYQYAAPGVTVTLTVTPDEGYDVGGLTVTTASGKAVEVTDNGDGTYSFKMPAEEVNVTLLFALKGSCPKDETCPIWPYTDASTTAWYHDGVHYVLERGIMGGYGNNLFGPNDTLTRAMVAQILYNMNARPKVTGKNVFTDVDPAKWYADAILRVSQNEYIMGYGDNKFGPDDPITREQLATIFLRYERKNGTVDETLTVTAPNLPDARTVSSWAVEGVNWCVAKGIISGRGNNGVILVAPTDKASRAEAATMIMRWREMEREDKKAEALK